LILYRIPLRLWFWQCFTFLHFLCYNANYCDIYKYIRYTYAKKKRSKINISLKIK
jgi:hypothetical protein